MGVKPSCGPGLNVWTGWVIARASKEIRQPLFSLMAYKCGPSVIILIMLAASKYILSRMRYQTLLFEFDSHVEGLFLCIRALKVG